MPALGNLLCLTPLESYAIDQPRGRNGILGKLERRIGPFVRSPGIAFPYLVGFLRKNGVIDASVNVAVQHDKIEGQIPFDRILAEKIDLSRGDHDLLFITSYTNSAREAYRRAREARATWAAAGRKLTVVIGGAHASALPTEGTRFGHLDAVVTGEGEWAAAELIGDLAAGRAVKHVYSAGFARIRERGTLRLDMDIWKGLTRKPHQIVASTHFARGCKLDCHFCAVFLTNGPNVRNRDVDDVVEEINHQGCKVTRDTLDEMGPGFYNSLLRALVRTPFLGSRYGDRLIAQMAPGFTDRVLFWDDNLYNAHGPFQALCEALRPLGRTWGAELTIDLAEKPELLKLAHDSGCRDLFLGIESISQKAIDGIDKWSNDTASMQTLVQRVHDAGINVMGAFVFGLDGDDPACFDRTLEFLYRSKIDFVVANIIQPYPGTGTFNDAVAARSFLPLASCPPESDIEMDYNWPAFDGAHVLTHPRSMSVEQLEEGYFYFLREAYSLTGILRRHRTGMPGAPGWFSHTLRNYLLSRYGMNKTAHAIARGREADSRAGLVSRPEGRVRRPSVSAAPAAD